ncbi:hypothetical protein [Sandaracinobacteroides hominis]|uniref:hypothetical protein n=1 Tax=Sandaracinobacteroides hominis TaxID=2780086 RepID=UPI0018F6A8DC|nr:hypothetical protein [Sandaracinobacteroides hominis]
MRNAALTRIAIAASTLIALVAMPGTPGVASSDPEFGCTVKQNIETQVVDMNPRYQGTLMEGGSGQRSAAAVSRYMNDKIRPLVTIDGRSEVGQQGGASASGDVSSSRSSGGK